MGCAGRADPAALRTYLTCQGGHPANSLRKLVFVPQAPCACPRPPINQPGRPCSRYCSFNTISGSTRDADQAGHMHASSATTAVPMLTVARIAGSVGVTPNTSPSSARRTPSTPSKPSVNPAATRTRPSVNTSRKMPRRSIYGTFRGRALTVRGESVATSTETGEAAAGKARRLSACGQPAPATRRISPFAICPSVSTTNSFSRARTRAFRSSRESPRNTGTLH